MTDNSAHSYSEGSEVRICVDCAKEKHELRQEIRQLREANKAVIKSSTFERFLDASEERVQFKQALRNVLEIMDEYSNIEILLSLKDRENLAAARKLLTK